MTETYVKLQPPFIKTINTFYYDYFTLYYSFRFAIIVIFGEKSYLTTNVKHLMNVLLCLYRAYLLHPKQIVYNKKK